MANITIISIVEYSKFAGASTQKTKFIFNLTIYWIVSFMVTSMPCITKYTKHLWRIASSDSAATACLRMFPHIYLLSPYHSPEKRIEDDPNFLTFVCVCVNRNKKATVFTSSKYAGLFLSHFCRFVKVKILPLANICGLKPVFIF